MPRLGLGSIFLGERLARHRERTKLTRRRQDRLLDKIERRCSTAPRDAWSRLVASPDEVHDRVRAALNDREALILPFGGGVFVMNQERTEFVGSISKPLDDVDRVYVVHESDRTLDIDTTVFGSAGVRYLPDATWLSTRRSSPACRGGRSPVIVSDPQSDLPGARRAGRRLAERYPDAQWLVGARATVGAVQNAWRDATWFFYGGHSTFEADAAETELVLADGRLDPAQIILQNDPPCVAVLLSCETALRASGQRPRLGLVDALLAAGASIVVATSSRINDRLAAELTKSLRLETPADIEVSLRAAFSRLECDHPGLASEIQIWGTTAH